MKTKYSRSMDCSNIKSGSKLVRHACACMLAMVCLSHEWGYAADAASLLVQENETQLARRLAGQELATEPPFEYSIAAGYRQDNLNWSIANAGVNVASEVSWRKTAISVVQLGMQFALPGRWFVRGSFDTGAVRSGMNQDSDYAGNDRTLEILRSDNRSGGAVRDASLGVGHRFSMGGQYCAPLLGFSIHQQAMTMYDGVQSVPVSIALPRLNSSYDAQWKGIWFGIDAGGAVSERVSWAANATYHRVDYLAEANWNLRNDLSHPLSFRHVAKGRGMELSGRVAYRVSRSLALNLDWRRQKWNTGTGYDETYFSYGAIGNYSLNSANWDSSTLLVGAAYRF